MKKMIDPNSAIPFYYQLKEILRNEIVNGIYVPGEKLPSENEFMRQFDVSRSTVRRALTELDKLGMIRTDRGKGTFVRQAKLEANLLGNYFRQQVIEKGHTLEIKLLESTVYKATDIDEKIFGVGPDDNIYSVLRLIHVNKEPMFIENLCIPEKISPNLLAHDLAQPFFDILVKQYKLNVDDHVRYIEPSLADDFEADHLQIKKNSPVLVVDRHSFTLNNEIPIFTTKWVVRGDRCKYLIKV